MFLVIFVDYALRLEIYNIGNRLKMSSWQDFQTLEQISLVPGKAWFVINIEKVFGKRKQQQTLRKCSCIIEYSTCLEK